MADGGAPAWGRWVGAAPSRRPPLGRWLFSVLSDEAPVLPYQFPANKTSPPLPMSGGASIFRWKSEEVFQLVFPRFFQKRQGGRAERRQWRKKRGGSPVSKGVEGSRFSGDAQRPLRTARGAEPPTGVQGRSPWQWGAGSPPHEPPTRARGEPPLKLFQAEAEAVQRLLPAQEERDLNGATGGHLFAGQGDAHGP